MVPTNLNGLHSLRLRKVARAECICAQKVILCSSDVVTCTPYLCPCAMEVKRSRLKMNAINIISRFLCHNKIKYVVYIAILLNCKFFILCPKLKLALQYNY